MGGARSSIGSLAGSMNELHTHGAGGRILKRAQIDANKFIDVPHVTSFFMSPTRVANPDLIVVVYDDDNL
jgi:hypothetical protein